MVLPSGVPLWFCLFKGCPLFQCHGFLLILAHFQQHLSGVWRHLNYLIALTPKRPKQKQLQRLNCANIFWVEDKRGRVGGALSYLAPSARGLVAVHWVTSVLLPASALWVLVTWKAGWRADLNSPGIERSTRFTLSQKPEFFLQVPRSAQCSSCSFTFASVAEEKFWLSPIAVQ